MPLGLYPYTGSGNPEWEELLRSREEGLDRMLQQMALSTVVHSQMPGLSPQDALGLAGPLLENDPQEQQRRAVKSQMRRTDRNHLLGAADFYGISDAERMPEDVLQQHIEGRRQYMRDWEAGRDTSFGQKLFETVATTVGIVGVGSTDAVLDLLQRMPFLGDALARTKTMQDVDRWFGQLEEGLMATLPEGNRKIATGLANMLGYIFPASVTWKLAGLAGAIPGAAQVGARLSPLGRAMLRGAAAEWMLEGGGDAPLSERALNIGLGAVFGAGEAAGGVLGRSLMGGGAGAIAGSLADDGDPRSMMIGAAVGAAGANALPLLFRRIQKSFPSRSYGGIDTELMPNDMAGPIIDVEMPTLPGERRLLGSGMEPFAEGGPELPPGGGPQLLGEAPWLEGTVEGPTQVGRGQPWLPPESSLQDAEFQIVDALNAARQQGPGAVSQLPDGAGALSAQMNPGMLPHGQYEMPGTVYTGPAPVRLILDQPHIRGIRHLAFETQAPTGENVIIEAYFHPRDGSLEIDNIVSDTGAGSPMWSQVPAGAAWTRQLGVEIIRQLDELGVPVGRIWGTRATGARGGLGINDPRKEASVSASRLRPGEASAEAANLSKSATLMESPALAEMAAQPTFGDVDVVRAVVESYPGQVGVVRNVGDVGKTIRQVLMEQMPNGVGPQDFRVVQRGEAARGMGYDISEPIGTQTDLLVTSGRPITDQMVQEYQTFGMFSGQRATTAQGNEVIIKSLGPETSTVAPLHGGADAVVPTRDLLPSKSSGMSDTSAPELYADFETFAQVRLDQQAAESGIPRLDLYGDEAATQLPLLMEEFTKLYGVQDNYHAATIRQLLEHEHLAKLRTMAPAEDVALLESIQNDLQVMRLEQGIKPATLPEIAEARGMTWVQGPGDSGTLRDKLSDLEVPVASREAAEEFLQGFDRELPDVSPATLVPMEIAGSPIGYNTASDLPNRIVDMEDWTRSVEAELESFDLVEEILEAEWSFMEGGGSGGRPPSDPPRVGAGPFSEGPFLPSNDPQAIYQRHNDEWRRLRRDNPRAYFEFERKMDSLVSRFFTPFRHLTMRVEDHLNRIGVTHGRIWQSYEAVETAHTRAISKAIPWQQRLSAIAENVRNRIARDGSFREVYTAPTVNDRERLMAKYNFTPAERQALVDLRALMDEFWGTEGRAAFPQMGYLENYWPTRVIRGDVPEHLSSLPDELTWQHQLHRRDGGEIDPSLVSAFSAYFRNFFKYTEMKPHYEHMKRLFNQDQVPESLKNMANGWLEARFWGLDPTQDKAIRGLRYVFEKVGIPMTHRDVTSLVGSAMTAQYRGMLGGRVDPVVRDLLQMLVPAARLGDFKGLGTILKDFGSNRAVRQEMIDRAIEGGWLQREYIKVADADIFSNNAWENATEASRFTPAQESRRESIARVGDFMKDRVMQPLGLKSGIQGRWIDPLMWYQKQGSMARIISGEMGWRKSVAALQRYDAARQGVVDETTMRVLRDRLLDESGVLMFQAPIKRKYMELVDAGDFEGASKMFANQVANLQNRYGATESPIDIREAGLVGRLWQQLGTHAQQQINEYAQVLNDTSIPRVKRLGYTTRIATIDAALGVGKQATGWNLRKLMITGGLLSPLAAPTLWALTNDFQRLLAKIREETGEPLGPDQMALLGSGGAPGVGLLSSFDPTGGFRRSISGFGEVLGTGPEATLRFMTTGERGDPTIDRWLMHSTVPTPPNVFPPQQPVGAAPTAPWQGFGTQNVDSILMQYPGSTTPTQSAPVSSMPSPPMLHNGVSDPSRVYEKNGQPVYDTPNRTSDGKVPTHSLNMPSGRRPDETWEQYEQRVINTPDSMFSPAARQVDNRPESLEPETQAKLRAMLAAAAAEGVPLSISETYRPPERQEWLFKEGRAPGRGRSPVTWTLTSSHADRRGADLRAGSNAGYQWIQQNAGRFGLSVLGAYDPGHVFTPSPQNPQLASGMIGGGAQ